MSLSLLEIVKFIHEYLTEYFEYSDDPVSPPGIKNLNLLESAVNRPFQTMGGKELFSTEFDKASALFHGLISNHAFHNGNKRTALLTAPYFLSENNYWVDRCSDEEMFEFTRKVAAHELCPNRNNELSEIKHWFEQNSRRRTKYEKQLSLRELKDRLNSCGYETVEDGRFIEIIETESGLRKEKIIKKGTQGIEPYDPVYIAGLRKRLRLTEDYGYDSERFYGNKGLEESINEFMEMRGEVIRELAKI